MADTVSEPWLSVELNIVLYVKQYGRHHVKEKKKWCFTVLNMLTS